MSRPAFLLNGRFLTRPMTGVDRAALHLVRGVLKVHAEGLCEPFTLDVAVPAGAPPDEDIRQRLALPDDSSIHRSTHSGYVWEQTELAATMPGMTLLSLCNSGPVTRENQLVLIHDAQVYDEPETFPLAFRKTYHAMLPTLAQRSRHVVAVSKYSRERLLAHGVGAGRVVEVVHNGVDHLRGLLPDTGILETHRLEPGGYFFAFDAREEHKNVALLMQANAMRRTAQMPLVLAGTGGGHPGPRAVRPAMAGAVRLGRVSDEELVALYRHARAFLLPARTEGFGLTAGEAMTQGCPVIAAASGALPEIYAGAALFLDPLDVAGWAAAMDELEHDDLTRATWANKAREMAVTLPWHAGAESLLKVLGVDVFDAKFPPLGARKTRRMGLPPHLLPSVVS